MYIGNLDKAKVLIALYNRAKVQGMGFLQSDPAPMSEEEATKLLEKSTYFDYLKGRVMKIDLGGDEVNTTLYNRDNGANAAENAIAKIK